MRQSKSAHDADDVRAETFLGVLLAIRGNQVRSPAALPGVIVGVTRNVLRELYARGGAKLVLGPIKASRKRLPLRMKSCSWSRKRSRP